MVGRLWALIVGRSERLIALAAGTLTLAGALGVLLAGGGSRATPPDPHPPAPAPPAGPPGSIVYARNTGTGVFHDSAGPFTITGKDRAVIEPLPGAPSCCFGT